MDITQFFGLKYVLTVFGGFFVMVGTAIEPQLGIWLVSIGGSLLTIAVGGDRTFFQIVWNLMVGLCWGVFGSQLFHGIELTTPQIADAFFLSFFGVSLTGYFTRNLKTGNFQDILSLVMNKFMPWKVEEKKPNAPTASTAPTSTDKTPEINNNNPSDKK